MCLCDKAVDAGDVACQRSHEQRGGAVQKQSAREEYADGSVAESLAAAIGWGRSQSQAANARNEREREGGLTYMRKLTATMTRKVRMPVITCQ